MVETIFSWPIFSDIIFPFLLVFTLLFAILEKVKILGEGKQNHALISLAVAMILIASPARTIIKDLAPFFAIFAVVLLIFLLLWGFVIQPSKEKPFDIPGVVKTLILIVLLVSVIIAVMVSTGFWPKLIDFFKTDWGTVANIITVIAIIVASIIIVKYSGAPAPK